MTSISLGIRSGMVHLTDDRKATLCGQAIGNRAVVRPGIGYSCLNCASVAVSR
jgi:hypothetical protein